MRISNHIKDWISLTVLLCLGAGLAYAGSSTVSYNASGTTPIRTTTDGSSNNLPNNTIWDSVAGANGLGITTNNAAKTEGVGTAGTPTGGVTSVQGVSGGTNLPVSQATAANLNATVVQATAANFNATVVGTGTFAVQAAVNAGTNVIGFTSNDPCTQATKLGASINLTASGQIITGTSAKKTYICSLDLISATTQNIALVEGTGSTCATNIFGLAGGTTAATGWNFVANGGLTKGSGAGTVYSPSADSNGTAANVCLLLSSTGQTSGQITYVQQ